MTKSKRHISAIKWSLKIFTIILHWSIQLKEIQYNWKQVSYLYLQEPLVCVAWDLCLFGTHCKKQGQKSSGSSQPENGITC